MQTNSLQFIIKFLKCTILVIHNFYFFIFVLPAIGNFSRSLHNITNKFTYLRESSLKGKFV